MQMRTQNLNIKCTNINIAQISYIITSGKLQSEKLNYHFILILNKNVIFIFDFFIFEKY